MANLNQINPYASANYSPSTAASSQASAAVPNAGNLQAGPPPRPRQEHFGLPDRKPLVAKGLVWPPGDYGFRSAPDLQALQKRRKDYRQTVQELLQAVWKKMPPGTPMPGRFAWLAAAMRLPDDGESPLTRRVTQAIDQLLRDDLCAEQLAQARDTLRSLLLPEAGDPFDPFLMAMLKEVSRRLPDCGLSEGDVLFDVVMAATPNVYDSASLYARRHRYMGDLVRHVTNAVDGLEPIDVKSFLAEANRISHAADDEARLRAEQEMLASIPPPRP